MGNTVGSSKKGKSSVLATKIDHAKKTCILNIANMDLKPNSYVWNSLMENGLNNKLKVLDISGNTLKTLPVEIYSMAQMKNLHASKCSILRTQNMLGLSRMVQLDLSFNDLESESLNVLSPSLQKLNLEGNHMVMFPVVLTELTNLQELNLSGNRLVSMHGVGALQSLILLNLDGNQIQEVSEDAVGLTNLLTISLKNNEISVSAVNFAGQSIPAEFFTNLKVENIDLTGNRLRNADVLQFRGVDAFLERRRRKQEKALKGGAMTDLSSFGLE